MKKLLIFIFVGIIGAIGLSLPKKDVFSMENVNSFTIVTSAAEAVKQKLDFVPNGQDAIVTVKSAEQARKIYDSTQAKCVIMTLRVENYQKTCDFLEISSHFTQKLDNMEILYAYSHLVSSSVMVEGKKVNVQIVKSGDEMIVGMPMIMTGF